MWCFIIFTIIILTISIIGILNILKLKKISEEEIEKNRILTQEKREHTIIINALSKINSNMVKSIEELDKIKMKKEKLFNSEIICDLEEQVNNIDALLNNDSKKQIIKGTLKDELNQIIKNIDGKIELEFPKNIDIEVAYDQRLLQAIKMLLSKSVQIDKKNEITIAVRNISKNRIEIDLENVNLVNDINNIEPVGALLNISGNPFDYVDCQVDSDFMIIRQYFLHSAKKVQVEVNLSKISISIVKIVLEPENLKRKRNNIMALVVDDNKPTAKMNQEVLKEIGIDSEAVYSADECMKEILTTFDEYDIIITDNQMPGKNGTDLIRDLKRIDGFDLPVVIVTGDRGQADYFINSCGFDGYIEKPLDKKKALQTIKKLIK